MESRTSLPKTIAKNAPIHNSQKIQSHHGNGKSFTEGLYRQTVGRDSRGLLKPRRRNHLDQTAQQTHSQKKKSQKRGIRSCSLETCSEKRKLSRRIYRLFKSNVLSSPPGLAKPVGVHTLAQETPKAQLLQHHANTLKFKATGRSSCFHRYKATYNLKTFAKDCGKGRHHPHKDPLGKWA